MEKRGPCISESPCLELAIKGQLETPALLHLQKRRLGLKTQEPQWRPSNLEVFLQRYVFLVYCHSTSCCLFHFFVCLFFDLGTSTSLFLADEPGLVIWLVWNVPLTCTSAQEEMDIRTLQTKNRKLAEMLDQRQAIEDELREHIEKLERRQATDDASLLIINRYWNQVSNMLG